MGCEGYISCRTDRFRHQHAPCQCRLSRSRDDWGRGRWVVLVLLEMLDEGLQDGIGDNSSTSEEVMVHLWAIC